VGFDGVWGSLADVGVDLGSWASMGGVRGSLAGVGSACGSWPSAHGVRGLIAGVGDEWVSSAGVDGHLQTLAACGGYASVFNAWGWALVAPGCVGGPYAAPALSLGCAKGQFNQSLWSHTDNPLATKREGSGRSFH
jgi:hypothetical protein